MKKVKFIQAWQQYSVGDVIEPFAAYGQMLVLSKKCEYVEEKKTNTILTLKKRKRRGSNTRNSPNK